MITLRLFREEDPDRQIDSYIMGDGEVSVGRDPGAVWVIDDPDRCLSRFHCTMAAREGGIFVRDTSANGVYLGHDGERMDPLAERTVPAGERLQIGQYVLLVDEDRSADDCQTGLSGTRTSDAPLQDDPEQTASNAIPARWAESGSEPLPLLQAGASGAAGEVVMLEAFCEGAGLDPSYLAGESPLEVMRRLGEIYQQVVLGLGDLMCERAAVKSEHRLERTRIGATANNPLKWAPTHRVAVDLLCEGSGGFLDGSDAVRECFEDLKGHSLCLVAGARAAVMAVLEEFDPKSIEADAKAKAPFFMERSEAAWRRMKSLHADISRDPFNDANSLVNGAFKYGYEERSSLLNPKAPEE